MLELILFLVLFAWIATVVFFVRKNTVLTERYIEATKETASLKSENSSLKEQKQQQVDIEKRNRQEFEILASKILDEKTKSLSEVSLKSIKETLTPLEKQLNSFESNIKDRYTDEIKERHSLRKEIEKLVATSDKMAYETDSLTQALRGDSKVQGDWGEFVLERILEDSGLRKEHEYNFQKSLPNEQGERLRPDVIINLPEKKHIIVDSKVSLKFYDLYRNAENELNKKNALGSFLKSIERHVQELSDKHYTKLKGITSPEIVFMFMPIEPAYLLAMQTDKRLTEWAFKKRIAIVTATTLLASLKTVSSIWRLENQNKNALEIAREGSRLYDKFAGFLDDFNQIGANLEVGHKQYLKAKGKLKEGPGNIFKKMERLKELGISPNKKIETHLTD